MEWIPRVYGELVPVIQRALDELDSPPVLLTASQILDALSGDDSAGPVDAACLAFAKTGRVPTGLPDAVKFAMSCRLRCARWYCHDLASSGEGEETAGEFLEGLLTDYWHDVGRFDWIQEDLLAGDYQRPE